MITRLMKIAVAIVVASLTLTACGSGETFPMASAEGLAKIRELVAEYVDTSKYKIYMVEWREDNRDRQLENILTHIDVYYLDADNNDYYLSFQLTNGKFTTDGPEQNDRQTNSYACLCSEQVNNRNRAIAFCTLISQGYLFCRNIAPEQCLRLTFTIF